MLPMKRKALSLLLCAFLVPAAQALATVLPESCGKDAVKYSVKVKTPSEGQPAPEIPPPAEGKAQIVFIETVNSASFSLTTPTTRFGVDGEWVGANRGDSHFAIDLSPGEHNVCVNWQSDSSSEANKVGLDTFTAEAGKVYYYEIKVIRLPEAKNMDFLFDFKQLGRVEGRYRAKVTGLSTSKLKEGSFQ